MVDRDRVGVRVRVRIASSLPQAFNCSIFVSIRFVIDTYRIEYMGHMYIASNYTRSICGGDRLRRGYFCPPAAAAAAASASVVF